MVTLENRPLLNANYRAEGVYFAHELIETVFAISGIAADNRSSNCEGGSKPTI